MKNQEYIIAPSHPLINVICVWSSLREPTGQKVNSLLINTTIKRTRPTKAETHNRVGPYHSSIIFIALNDPKSSPLLSFGSVLTVKRVLCKGAMEIPETSSEKATGGQTAMPIPLFSE